MGGSLKEVFHAGVLFGDRTSFGGYMGGWESLWSGGLNIKRHFNGTGKYRPYSPRFIRIGSGFLVEPGSEGTDFFTHEYYKEPATMELVYLAITYGRVFYFNKTTGMSFEVGGMFLPPLKPGTLSNQLIPVLPAVSLKIFIDLIKSAN